MATRQPIPSARRRVCVFCGSSSGTDPAYLSTALAFAELLVGRRLGLVYGGGNIGLMGALADAVLAGGGEVIGVIPAALRGHEVAHKGLTELQVVDTMHERKRRMYAQSDAIVALPGGIGTLEELLEAFTWNQLGVHSKPAGILNVGGYYDPLIAMFDRAVQDGFLSPDHRDLLVVADHGAELLAGIGL